MGCHSDVINSSGHNNDCSYVFVLSDVTLLTPYCVYLAFPHLTLISWLCDFQEVIYNPKSTDHAEGSNKTPYKVFLTFLFIFTSQGIVILYLYTMWQKSLSESWAWRCLWRKIVIFCQPIRTIFSIKSSVDMQFSLSISTKNMFCLRNERSSVIGSIWWLWNLSNRSQNFSGYFCQGIV